VVEGIKRSRGGGRKGRVKGRGGWARRGEGGEGERGGRCRDTGREREWGGRVVDCERKVSEDQ